MNKLFVTILIIISIGFAQDSTAVDTTWQKELIGSLNFSQAYFDNWAAGGENNLAGQFDLGGKIIKNSEKYTWTNTGKIAYGSSQVGDTDAKKTIDEIKVESLLIHLWKFQPDPYISLKGETQLAPGYAYGEEEKTQVSAFLDPAYFTQSAGFIYVPTEELSVRFGAAIKETLTKDFHAPFADDPDTEEIEKTKVEPGAEAVVAFTKKLSETTQINSTLDLFNNFKGFDRTDVKWDTDLTTQITKYINVKLNVKLFYDRDISVKRQLNQALMLGVSYTFL